MAERVDAQLPRELEKFGKGDWNACFQCGNCTSTCPLSDSHVLFPRKGVTALQMGLKRSLSSSLEPWLCYYCGDCSKQCPRNANPGELMMVLRRYLTSVYDWTGLSRRFYTSHVWELAAIFIIGAIVAILFGVVNPNGIAYDLNAQGGARVNEMFPVEWVHRGDWAMAAGIALLLVSNIVRMWYFAVYREKTRISLSTYIAECWQLVVHFASQMRFAKCDDKRYWASHWFLMSGYTVMFTMIVVFLPWFQTEAVHSWYHPQRLLGYYATIGLFVGLGYFALGRVRRSGSMFEFTHISDWLFLVMLFLTTVTGILLHFFRIYGLPAATYYTYILHMAVLVPMLVVEVPFSKWSHLAYRPFAVYLAQVKRRQGELDARNKLQASA